MEERIEVLCLLYQKFVEIGKKVSPDYLSMIMPARWYAGGRGLDEFRHSMLTDKKMTVLVDYETSKNLFPTVDIAGGLCYFLWSNSHNDLCKVINSGFETSNVAIRALNDFDVFIRSNRAISVVSKVKNTTNSFLNSLVLPINPFGFRTYFRGRENKLKDDIKILSSNGWGYVSRNDVEKNADLINKYKVLVGRFVPSNGELNIKPGDKYRVITNPQLLAPKEIHTETYINVAVFGGKEEAENYMKYLQSKFARFLLRQSITSVNVTKECFSFVPVLNFTEEADIDWSLSINEIDMQLYSKFGLTAEEIGYIESMIKPID
jgi:site-specific DNA-methyltransferase (adenine-specific)